MSILSRILRAESLMPLQSLGAVILREPPPEANGEAVSAFASAIVAEQSTGRSVIVVCNGTNRLRRPGVTYVDNDLDALLHKLAATPSSTHKNALGELIASIQGSALPVVREVSQ